MSLIQLLEPVGPVERPAPILDAADAFGPGGRHAAGDGAIRAIDVRSLSPGTTLRVETANSRYEMALQDEPAVAVMQGGAALAVPARVRIVGSIGAVGRIIGVIAVGLRLEVAADGQRVLTSRVRRITVTPGEA